MLIEGVDASSKVRDTIPLVVSHVRVVIVHININHNVSEVADHVRLRDRQWYITMAHGTEKNNL